jgi:hypothetical protein
LERALPTGCKAAGSAGLEYLLAQAWYLRVVSGRLPGLRLATAGALILAGAISLAMPPYAALALMTSLLAALAATSLREAATSVAIA